MNSFYRAHDRIKDELLTIDNLNTIVEDRGNDADLFKKNIYPMGVIYVENGDLFPYGIVNTSAYDTFTFRVMVVSPRDFSNSEDSRFYRNDNYIDNLNICYDVLKKLGEKLLKVDNGVKMTAITQPIPGYLDYNNGLDGWQLNITLEVVKNYICK